MNTLVCKLWTGQCLCGCPVLCAVIFDLRAQALETFLIVVIHINEFAHCEAGWIALFQVFALITRMFLCTFFFVIIGNINTLCPILHLVFIIIKGKLLWIYVQASTLLSLRNEGRKEAIPFIHFIFFPQFQPAITTARTNKCIICLKLLKHLAECKKKLKDGESQMKFNSCSSTLMRTWA